MNETAFGGVRRGAGGGGGGGRAWNVAAGVGAVLISGMLGVAAYAKWTGPNKGKTLFGNPDLLQDQVIAVIEVVIIVALLVGHRMRLAWMALALMFGGFAGYAGHYFSLGENCGCFGTLIELPTWGTLAIDLVIVAVASVMLLARRVKPAAVGGVLVGAALLSGVGWVFADATYVSADEAEQEAEREIERERRDGVAGDVPVATGGGGDEGADGGGGGGEPVERVAAVGLPGRADGPTAMERLLRSDLLLEARSGSVGDLAPAWYVFVWDPDCETCLAKLPDVEFFEVSYPGDDFLRVVTVTKREVESAVGIRYSAWRGSPTVFVVRQGRVTNVTYGEEAELPVDVWESLQMGDYPATFPGEGAGG